MPHGVRKQKIRLAEEIVKDVRLVPSLSLGESVTTTYANRSIARLVRSITVRRLSYGTENWRALTTTSRNTDRPHPLIDG